MQHFQNYRYSYVDSCDSFAMAIKELQAEKLIAIDTEFCRKKTYYPILSTIQIAGFGEARPKVFIIDCLAISNPQEIFALISNDKIIKIFHSALQDLQILLKLSKSKPEAVFDTQIMANLCGFDFNIGYGNLVEKLFAQKLPKEQQISDWRARPLSQNQINYAINDVLYLANIFQHLQKELEVANRLDWLAQEMDFLIGRATDKNVDHLLKKFDIANKTANEISRLQQLINWRELAAQNLDIPRQYVMRDEFLESISLETISAEHLEKMLKKTSPQFSSSILQILKSSQLSLSQSNQCQIADKSSLWQKEIAKKIQKFVRQESQICGISEQFLLSKSSINKIIEQKKCRELLTDWRYQLLGSKIEPILRS